MNNFISESELLEKKKKRQEEWDKVRKPEEPKEVPDEPYDPRSLFERLQEQKDKKQQEFEDAIKFKNQFRGIDKDEVEFLDLVADKTAQLEKQKNDEIKKELEEFRLAKHVADTAEINSSKQLETKQDQSGMKRKSAQSLLLIKAVKKKRKLSQDNPDYVNSKDAPINKPAHSDVMVYPRALHCAGVLPGIGDYSNESDSSATPSSAPSSDSES